MIKHTSTLWVTGRRCGVSGKGIPDPLFFSSWQFSGKLRAELEVFLPPLCSVQALQLAAAFPEFPPFMFPLLISIQVQENASIINLKAFYVEEWDYLSSPLLSGL